MNIMDGAAVPRRLQCHGGLRYSVFTCSPGNVCSRIAGSDPLKLASSPDPFFIIMGKGLMNANNSVVLPSLQAIAPLSRPTSFPPAGDQSPCPEQSRAKICACFLLSTNIP